MPVKCISPRKNPSGSFFNPGNQPELPFTLLRPSDVKLLEITLKILKLLEITLKIPG